MIGEIRCRSLFVGSVGSKKYRIMAALSFKNKRLLFFFLQHVVKSQNSLVVYVGIPFDECFKWYVFAVIP